MDSIHDNNPLYIYDEYDFNNTDHSWSSIIVNDNILNNIQHELKWTDYPNLEYIYIRKNSLTNIQSLIIKDLPELKAIIIEDNSFKFTDLSLESLFFSFLLNIETPKLEKLIVGKNCFTKTEVFTLTGISYILFFMIKIFTV